MISRKLLCAAVLACVAPLSAAAADGYLTPGKNGGSGKMPSGYSNLYFELAENDWARIVTLPERPQAGDRVTLSSLADSYAILDARKTVFEDQIHIPVDSLSNAEFRWSAAQSRWDVVGGLTARLVTGRNTNTLQIPDSEHTLTQVGLYDTKRASTVQLPAWARNGSLLVVANASSADVTVRGVQAQGTASNCEAGRNCAFVFGADGVWYVRLGNGRQQATESLPTPAKRWTDVFLSSPADDPLLPQEMRLPREAVCGDVYQFTNLDTAQFTRVSAENTDLKNSALIRKGHRYVFRFDGAQGRWIHQRVK
ncbi:hypothetical protein [Stenotrophomonas sepilia]|uniref:hypothetical protein n=1 Tax=Stenotrophomonas sepilia TaxID=2860290 RepID=UPI003341210E